MPSGSSSFNLLSSSPIEENLDSRETFQLQNFESSNNKFAEKLEADISDSEEDDDDDLQFRTDSDQLTTREMVLRILCIALVYYTLSISLTFYQKWFIAAYKLPLFVVSGHYVIKYLLAIAIRFIYECFYGPRIRVPYREQLRWLAPIGICASMDIGLSNWALEYVTVSLYTMAKSSSILFIVAFSLFLRLERWRTSLGLEAALIACGLFLFTWKSSQLDLTGLFLIELAAACTGVRWTVSQLVMQKDNSSVRNPLDMVAHLQPWMMIPIIPLTWFFEGPELSWNHLFSYKGHYDPLLIFSLIAGGGFLAFCMEMSEYLLLVNTSGITLNIFGIIKEVATLLLAHHLNNDKLSEINICGLMLCLIGMSVHGMNKRRQRTSRHVLHQSSLTNPSSLSKSDKSTNRDDSRKLLMEHDELEA